MTTRKLDAKDRSGQTHPDASRSEPDANDRPTNTAAQPSTASRSRKAESPVNTELPVEARSSFGWRAAAAVAGLVAFFGVYFLTAALFTFFAVRMVAEFVYGGPNNMLVLLLAAPPAAMAFVLIKSLFGIQSARFRGGLWLRRRDQPDLFELLDEIAAAAKSPKPRHVFLTPEINAAVTSDITLANLLRPSQKDLIIGAGLVTALNRSEFRAVLAHEFGHVAHRSTVVGRWAGQAHVEFVSA